MIFRKVLSQQDMRDPRWTTKDKLTEYRGILRLCGRERNRKYRQAGTMRNQLSCQLAALRTSVKEYRGILRNNALEGFERHAHAFLQDRTDLQIRCRDHGIEASCLLLETENFAKRRELDRLRYEKERKIERCLALQFERVQLSTEGGKEGEGTAAADRTKQVLVTRYQRSMARQNAAKAIRSTYASVLAILKGDAVHHESLLNELKRDQKEQCAVILRATLMGQLATESGDDVSMKSRRIARHVWKGMKERERRLARMHHRVEDLWSYARSLIRTESSPDLREKRTHYDLQVHTNLEKEMESLQQVFHTIRESLLANSYLELFSRLEEQAKQRARLFEQFERNAKEREHCMKKRAAALTELSNLERSLITTTQRCRTEVQAVEDQIESQRKREMQRKTAWTTHGELILEIKAALRNMVALLITVRKSGKAKREEKDQVAQLEKVGVLERTETEGLALLSDVSRKVGMLFGISNFELEPEKDDKARDMYRSYVSACRSRMTFSRSEADSTSNMTQLAEIYRINEKTSEHRNELLGLGFLVEHEMVDSSVPTRGLIKLHSKQLMEAHLKLD